MKGPREFWIYGDVHDWEDYRPMLASEALDDRIKNKNPIHVVEYSAYEEIKNKYESNGIKCNAGHLNHLPLSMWDCPMCVELIRSKLVIAVEALEYIFNYPGVITPEERDSVCAEAI